MQKFRTVVKYGSYFDEFLEEQNNKVKKKIEWTLLLLEQIEFIPSTYLKHIEDTAGLYEIRIQFGSDIFRIFCFFDDGRLIVLANGFNKKTQKTPRQEIDKALKIMKDYYDEKEDEKK